MSIIRDWFEEHEGYRLRTKIVHFLSPKVWLRLHKWRVQRANRGWSDRDTWGAGDHIAKMTAEMLQHLIDKSHIDWPLWFTYNIKDSSPYTDLQQVVDDINNYLEFQEELWSDDLEMVSHRKYFTEDDEYQPPDYVDTKTGKKLTKRQVSLRIGRHAKRQNQLYKKATRAMQFFGRHFTQFWD